MKKKQLQRALDEATAEVQQHRDNGSNAFLISFNYLKVCGGFPGTFAADIPHFSGIAQQHLLDMGLNVRGASQNEWEYTVTFECEVPAPVEATKQCPMCAEQIKEAALVCRYCGHKFE